MASDAVARIAQIMDRLAHESTNDLDAIQTVHALRRVVKGTMPSHLIEEQRYGGSRQMRSLRDEYNSIRSANQKLTDTNAQLRRKCDELLAENMQAQTYMKMRAAEQEIPAERTAYSYFEVMDIVREKFGKHNGAFTAWAQYSASLCDESVPEVTVHAIQSWRRTQWFPAWAVKQLLAMPKPDRVSHKWTNHELEYLCRIHIADVHKTDAALADECSRHFGVRIQVNAIKSKLHALRRRGRVPQTRPGRR